MDDLQAYQRLCVYLLNRLGGKVVLGDEGFATIFADKHDWEIQHVDDPSTRQHIIRAVQRNSIVAGESHE